MLYARCCLGSVGEGNLSRSNETAKYTFPKESTAGLATMEPP